VVVLPFSFFPSLFSLLAPRQSSGGRNALIWRTHLKKTARCQSVSPSPFFLLFFFFLFSFLFSDLDGFQSMRRVDRPDAGRVFLRFQPDERAYFFRDFFFSSPFFAAGLEEGGGKVHRIGYGGCARPARSPSSFFFFPSLPPSP